MRHSEWDFPTIVDESDERTFAKSPEDRVEQFGVRTALLVLGIAFFLAAMWLASRPSFEKCSALENAAARYACFDAVRNDSLKPPAKGAAIPNE